MEAHGLFITVQASLQSPEHAGSVGEVCGLSCPTCGIFVPQTGIKSILSALEGEFLTPGQPGSPWGSSFDH